MSRHQVQLGNNETFAYGYDHPLGVYFYQYIGENEDVVREGEGSASVLLTEISELGQKLIPMNHLMDIAMDLPIRDS